MMPPFQVADPPRIPAFEIFVRRLGLHLLVRLSTADNDLYCLSFHFKALYCELLSSELGTLCEVHILMS